MIPPSFDVLGALLYAGITILCQCAFRSAALFYRILASIAISFSVVAVIATFSGHEFQYFSRENIRDFVIGLTSGLICHFALRFLWLRIRRAEPSDLGPGR